MVAGQRAKEERGNAISLKGNSTLADLELFGRCKNIKRGEGRKREWILEQSREKQLMQHPDTAKAELKVAVWVLQKRQHGISKEMFRLKTL